MRFDHFNYITFVRGIGPSPARVNRKTGELQINLDVWPKLKPEHKKFVLLHEEGHRVLNTSNELAVDEYAFNKYAQNGGSLTESVKALTQVLSGRSPEHGLRAYLQLERAKQYDYFINKNERAKQPHYDSPKTINQSTMFDTFLDDIQDGVESSYMGEGTDNFLGIAIGKKAKAKKELRVAARQERKADRHAAKMERKAARSENIRSKAASRTTLANQGIVQPGAGDAIKNIGQALGPVAGIAGNLATGGALGSIGGLLGSSPVQEQVGGAVQQQTTDAAAVYQSQLPAYATPTYQEAGTAPAASTLADDGSKKKMLMIGGGIAAVIVIILIVVLAAKGKTKK